MRIEIPTTIPVPTALQKSALYDKCKDYSDVVQEMEQSMMTLTYRTKTHRVKDWYDVRGRLVATQELNEVVQAQPRRRDLKGADAMKMALLRRMGAMI